MSDGNLFESDDVSLNDMLSPRERQLMVMAAEGLTDQGIAHKLGISVATVSTYWGRVRIKFGPMPRPELIAHFVRGEMTRSAAELTKKEATLRALLTSTPLGVIMTDSDGTVLYVNPAYEEISGRSIEALEGTSALDVVHPDDRNRVAEAWNRCFSDGVPYSEEYRYLRPDGVRDIRAWGNVWRFNGTIGGRVAVIEDVTEARSMAEACAEALEGYQTLFSLTPEAILSADESQMIVEFSPGAERLFGYEASEAIGKPLSMLLPLDGNTPHQALVEVFRRDPEREHSVADRVTVRGRRKTGEEFYCEASVVHRTVQRRPLYTAIVRDVNDPTSDPEGDHSVA